MSFDALRALMCRIFYRGNRTFFVAFVVHLADGGVLYGSRVTSVSRSASVCAAYSAIREGVQRYVSEESELPPIGKAIITAFTPLD